MYANGGVNDEIILYQCLPTIGRDSPRRRDIDGVDRDFMI